MKMESGEANAGFAARFKKVVDEDRRTATALAEGIARSEGAVRNWMMGRSQPVVVDVLRFCELTGTRVEWLMIGQGPQREIDPPSVGETQATYRATFFDESLLAAITLAVERELRAQPNKLSAEKKSTLIAHCFRFMGTMANFDAQTVARLIKLAS